jgi:CHAT domain
MQYEEFHLLASQVREIKGEGTKHITFQVQIPRSPAGEIISGESTAYDVRELRTLLRGWDAGDLDWPTVIQVGNSLTNILFPPPVRELFVHSIDRVKAQGRRLRLRLMLEGPLHNLPWEYMLLNRAGGEATPTDFLALAPDISIVRHQAATIPAWSVKAELPAQILAALASPAGLASLKIDKEHQVIATAVKDNQHVQVLWKENPTLENLLVGVMQAHLFHFAGHGALRTEMAAQPGTYEGEGLIVLDDGYGDPAEVSAHQLALQLRQIGVRVAVLGACQSGRHDDVNVWSSVAAALLKAELGAVVGMQYKVRDDSAIAFASAFYARLVTGLTIDEAVTAGRIKVAQTDAGGWGIPVLYLRAEDGVIFPEYAANPNLEPARKQLRIEAEQHIGTLRGKATTIKIGRMTEGEAQATQDIGTVEEGGKATVVEIENLGGGSVEAHQKVDEAKGNVTGVRIDKLG